MPKAGAFRGARAARNPGHTDCSSRQTHHDYAFLVRAVAEFAADDECCGSATVLWHSLSLTLLGAAWRSPTCA